MCCQSFKIFRAAALLWFIVPGVSSSENLIQQGGPYLWTVSNGTGTQISLTVRVYSDVEGYAGQYVWDYQFDNISSLEGLANVSVAFADEINDVVGISWPTDFSFQIDQDNGKTLVQATGAISSETGPHINLGGTGHLRFATLPRAVLYFPTCGENPSYCAGAVTSWQPIIPQSYRPQRRLPLMRRIAYRTEERGTTRAAQAPPFSLVPVQQINIHEFDFFSDEALFPGDLICETSTAAAANSLARQVPRLSASEAGGTSLSITSPLEGSNFQLMDSDVTATTLSFIATGPSASSSQPQGIDWNAVLTYRPSQGNFGPFTDKRSFSSVSGSAVTSTYTGVGGQLRVNAKTRSCPAAMNTATVTITGNQVLPNDMKSYLLSLYQNDPNMATPNLLVLIAKRESTMRQFCIVGADCFDFQTSLFGSNGPWPLEGKLVVPKPPKKPALHVGLMQPQVNEDNAWNWMKNADAGLQILDEKFTYVKGVVRKPEPFDPICATLHLLNTRTWHSLNTEKDQGKTISICITWLHATEHPQTTPRTIQLAMVSGIGFLPQITI